MMNYIHNYTYYISILGMFKITACGQCIFHEICVKERLTVQNLAYKYKYVAKTDRFVIVVDSW